jgi:SH3-like domain-containing protein
MMAHIVRALGALLLLFAGSRAPAAPPDPDAVLKTPRFVSLRSDKVNLRTGPGRQYPIEWVLTRRDMPVEITARFEHWRRVREWDGTAGWVQEHMVYDKRFVVIEKGGDRPLRAAPDADAAIVARAEPGAVAQLLACQSAWCRIAAQGISGWLPRDAIWGVAVDETVP